MGLFVRCGLTAVVTKREMYPLSTVLADRARAYEPSISTFTGES